MIFIGVVGVSVNNNAEVNRENYRGLLAALATAVLWAIGTVLVALGLNEMSTILANTVRFPFLLFFLLPVSRFWKKKLRLTKRDWIYLATSGILGMTLGGIAFLFSVQLIGASRATSLSSSSPVLASLMSSFFLKEKVTWRIIASSVMVVLGIYFLT
jgi:drug/metabolite transporter (DMT)-like permease